MFSAAIIPSFHPPSAVLTVHRGTQPEDIRRAVEILLRVPCGLEFLCPCKICLPDNRGICFIAKIAYIFEDTFEPCLVPAGDARQIFHPALVEVFRDPQQGPPVQIGGEYLADRLALVRVRDHFAIFHFVSEGDTPCFHEYRPSFLSSDFFREGKPAGKPEAQGVPADYCNVFHDLPEQFLIKCAGRDISGNGGV